MQIQPPIKTYTLRSGRNHTPIQQPITPAQPNKTTNGEKNGAKNGDKENVTPGKPAEVVTQKKKGILKTVSDSKVLSELVRQGIVPNVSRKRKTLTKVVTLDVNSSSEVISDSKVLSEPVRQSSVANVSRKRKTLTKIVTLDVNSSSEVISDSKVITEPVRQSSVANISQKRKRIPVTPEEDSGVSDGTVVTPNKRGIVKVVKPVSALAVPKSVEPVRQSSVANVSRKRKQIPMTPEEDSGVNDGTVVTPNKRGIVKVAKPVSALAVPKSVEPQTDVEDVTTGKAAVVSKKIRKPTLVPTAMIPSTSQSQGSDYDDDSQIDVE